jgi:hypothetical protein
MGIELWCAIQDAMERARKHGALSRPGEIFGYPVVESDDLPEIGDLVLGKPDYEMPIGVIRFDNSRMRRSKMLYHRKNRNV